MAVSSDETTVELAVAREVKANPAQAARGLCRDFARTLKAAGADGRTHSTSVLLVDGLNGAGESLVNEVLDATRSFQQVVGGAAGDDGAFKATHVGGRGEAASDGAAALHAFARKPWGVGVDHGLRPRSNRMRVTRASANVVQQIDNRPAFEVYRDFAAERGVSLTPENAGAFLIANELGIHVFDELRRARAPLSVGADGSLTCAAAIPEGASVSILDGEPDSMVAAARRAAEEAHRNLAGNRAAAVLLFDCVCRGMILDGRFGQEIDAVRAVFPDVPVAGLLTYGEIARFKGRLDGWHNATAVVTAIPAQEFVPVPLAERMRRRATILPGPRSMAEARAGATAVHDVRSETALRLAELGRELHARGWVLGTSGNFSAVLSRDPLRVAITPRGADKGRLDPAQILEVDGGGRAVAGAGRPSDETRLHLAVVAARGAGAVLHTHSVWATLLSDAHAAEGGLAIEGYEMLKGLEGVGTHAHREWVPILENSQDWAADAPLVEGLLRDRPEAHAFLIRGHGLYTWGRDLAQARRHLEVMEFLLEVVGRAGRRA